MASDATEMRQMVEAVRHEREASVSDDHKPAEKVIDLMEALKKSLEPVRHERDASGPAEVCPCGNVTHRAAACHVCEWESDEGSRYGRMPTPERCCTDCHPGCISCGQPTCESHRRESGECTSCSGPTDAELAAGNPQ